MRIAVVSYSLTGNNEALAARVARELGAEHIKIAEPKPRGMKDIALDMLFGRVPATTASPEDLPKDAALLLFAPVWMGKVASPLRACLKGLKAGSSPYAFVSISGGADGPGSNARLSADLRSRAGREPAALVDLHIAELLPRDPKPTRDDTSAYKLTETDIKSLSARVIASLKGKLP